MTLYVSLHNIKHADAVKPSAAFAHLRDLFLERERESGSSVGEGAIPVGYVLQPLDDEGGRDVEREVPYDVEVRRICGDTHV